MLDKLEELLVRAIAKRKGIPEEEAKLLLEAMKESGETDELKQFLTDLVDIGEVVSKFPSNVQPLAVPLFMQTLQSQGSSLDRLAERVAVISAAIKAAYGGDDGYQKLIEDLRREIQALREEKMRQEQEMILQQVEETFNSVKSYIEALEKKIEQLEKGESKTKDELDALEEYLEKVERTKEKLKKLGLVKEKEEPDIDLQKAEELLRKAGYKIEKPLTWDSLQRYIEEQMKKIKEEAKKEAMEELKVEEKRMAMIVDLITTIAGTAFEALAEHSEGSESAKAEELRRRFEEWRQRLTAQAEEKAE